MPTDITQLSGGLVRPQVSPPPSERREARKQAVSKHNEAGRRLIWVRHIDLIPSPHGSGVRLCVSTRGHRVSVGNAARKTANQLIHSSTWPPEPPLSAGRSRDAQKSILALNRHAALLKACKEATAANICALWTQLFFVFVADCLFPFWTMAKVMSAMINARSEGNKRAVGGGGRSAFRGSLEAAEGARNVGRT